MEDQRQGGRKKWKGHIGGHVAGGGERDGAGLRMARDGGVCLQGRGHRISPKDEVGCDGK